MAIKELAYIDDLTQLANRRAFREQIQKDISAGGSFYLILVDIDHFKKINDTFGHANGDYMIREFSKIIVEGLKETDNLAARYGGDEFVIILRTADKTKATSIWDAIRQNVAQRDFILPQGQHQIKITTSIGIAEYPADAATDEELFQRADEALYSSKRLGRNRVSFAKDSLQQVKEEKRIQNILLKAPFTGRDKELQEIKNYLFAKEPHKLVLVESDIGGGKSRLLEETANLAKKQNMPIFSLTATEIDKSKPYGILVDIINAIALEHHDLFQKAYQALEPKEQQVLTVFPKLKALIGEAAAADIGRWDAEARSSLFQGVSELFEFMLLDLKPIIFIDNIDWIDEPSIGVLSFIIVSKRYTPLRILASDSRPPASEPKRQSFLDSLLYEISEFEIVPHIKLSPLSEEESRELIQSVFSGCAVPEDFIQEVARITQGNPLFIIELLRDLISRGVIYLKYPDWIFNEKKERLPHDLRELLTNKFKELDQEEKELLLAASGIGGNFKFDFLSKLKKLNEGYVEDIISKAVDKNIFNKEEAGQRGVLSFKNELTRGIFYEAIDAQAKKNLHLNIANTLESEFKDSLEAVSSELVFHYNRAEIQNKVREYAPLALSYVDKLFSETQTEKIIDEAIRAREERDRQEPIKEQSWPLVNDIVSAFNSAVKSMHMYQRDNEVTQKMLDRCFATIKNYFKLQYNLTFSNPQGETKDSTRFLINGQEFPETGFVEKLISKQFVGILRDFDIGSITFRKTLSRDELERFIIVLADEKMFREKKENWQKIFSNNKITSIKIDEVIYRRVLTEEEKKEFHKEVLKDLLAKKVLGSDITVASAAAGPSVAGAKPEILDKKVRQVTGEEKNILAKTIARLPPEMVVDTIASEYASRKSNLIDIKDMVSVCMANAQNKMQLASLLKDKLQGLGMSREGFEWLMDDSEFLKQPLKKRANIYINTDPKTILEIGVEENLKATLTDLFGVDEQEIAREIISKYLDNLKNPAEELRVYMANTLSNIVDAIPDKAASGYTDKIVSLFLEALDNEKDDIVYGLLVKNIDFLIYKLLRLEDYQSILKLVSKLKIHTAKDFTPDFKRIAAKKAMQEMDWSVLIDTLIGLLDKVAFLEDKNILILEILRKLIPQSLPQLFELLGKRISRQVPFEWYQQDLMIIQILKENKDEAVREIEGLLSSEAREKIELACYILKEMRDDSLVYLYEKALASDKAAVRSNCIGCLIELDTAASLKLLEKAYLHEAKDAQKNIIAALGQQSKNRQALDFLLRLKALRSQAQNRKEIAKSIGLIKKRVG
ncbi:MAG: diguanylate cyclase [Candidatus Omnitrophica bacterium]|nr:diguanylate cyclase [Candidatus Omnitrophota bacterium]